MVALSKHEITYTDVVHVARHNKKVSLDPKAKKNVELTRQAVENVIKNKEIAYGITTGFGAFKNKVISQNEVKKLQENLILSHAVGVGKPFSEEIVRGIMFLVANYLSKGYSGVRPIIIETL